MDRCVSEFGSIEVYFANAGVMGRHTELEDSPLADFQKTIAVRGWGRERERERERDGEIDRDARARQTETRDTHAHTHTHTHTYTH